MFAELDNYGKKTDINDRMARATPKADSQYFKVGTVNHKNTMNTFLKEASEFDK